MRNGNLKLYKNRICASSAVEQTARNAGKALIIVLAINTWAAIAEVQSVIVGGTNQSNIVSAIGSACNGNTPGKVIFPNGNYSVSSPITVPGNCALQAANPGRATLNANQNQVFNIASNYVTINGFIIDGGWVAFGGANSYSNFVFTNNTIENIWSGYRSGGPVALSGPGIISSNISNNSFLNIWGGGSPGYPNTPPQDGTNCPGEDCWGSFAMTFSGLDQTTISNNTFDRIAGDGMHISWESFTGYTYAQSTSGNVISYNTFTHIRRIPMELQSQPSGNCPGGCNYSPSTGVTTGLQIKGNYVHDYAWPFWNTWGASLVPAGAVGSYFINNTFVANPGNAGGYAPCMESSSINNIVQGNVCESTTGETYFYSAGVAQEWGGNSTQTSTYQNNVFCGNPATLLVAHETGSQTTIVDRYNYKNGSSCPAGANLTTGNINLAFTSANNQSFPSGGNGTWSVYVISNLSIRYVQFFVDGSTTPVSTQEIQDLNSNFANDQRWLYHATINTSTLTSGTHTISAIATDVSGVTQKVTENFTANGSGGGTVPGAIVSPDILSFSATTVGQTTQTQTATLTNSGTAALALGNITLGGPNSADFSLSSQCGSSLAVGSSCVIEVGFNPMAAGSRTATLSVSDNAANSPQSVALTGTGNAPAPVATPPTTGNLPTNLPKGMILWLAGNSGVLTDGSGVSAWQDQSGNGNNALQPSTANQPTLVPGNNGQYAVRFDGSSSFMSLANLPINGSTGLTVILVSANSTDVSNSAGYGWYSFLLWQETASWGATFFGTYQSTSQFRFGTTQFGNESTYTTPFNRTNSFGLSEWMHAGTTDYMWFNSQSVGTFPGKLAAIAGVGNSAVLGLGNTNTFYPGDVSELIVYGRSISTSERQAIEEYLMTKYHL
jgi:hypothetical protein